MKIEIQNVNFSYDKIHQVLSDINLNIPSGTTLALIGSNGCGKTTLARCLNGILHPQTGKILSMVTLQRSYLILSDAFFKIRMISYSTEA
jgi:ABC-type bacteriocin/lantibiotic exporter with double-glycine peptidase domain